MKAALIWRATFLAFAVIAAIAPRRAAADLLPIVNPSFELPHTNFAIAVATGWTIAGPPETGVAGVFSNNSTPAGSPAHITNPDGTQLAFISSESGNEMTQLLSAHFIAGHRYTLNVGVAVSYSLPPSSTNALHLGLFYLDDNQQRQFVAMREVFNDPANGLSASLLNYFEAQSPSLSGAHDAIGRPIGIFLGAAGRIGGYFDMDNVSILDDTPCSPLRVLAYPPQGDWPGIGGGGGMGGEPPVPGRPGEFEPKVGDARANCVVAVPEPASLFTAAALFAGMLQRRRHGRRLSALSAKSSEFRLILDNPAHAALNTPPTLGRSEGIYP